MLSDSLCQKLCYDFAYAIETAEIRYEERRRDTRSGEEEGEIGRILKKNSIASLLNLFISVLLS